MNTNVEFHPVVKQKHGPLGKWKQAINDLPLDDIANWGPEQDRALDALVVEAFETLGVRWINGTVSRDEPELVKFWGRQAHRVHQANKGAVHSAYYGQNRNDYVMDLRWVATSVADEVEQEG